MTRPLLKAVLNLCLMIAVVALQLSSAHIHVAEHHQHDGSHHAHASKAHSHALSAHHTDAFDNTPDSTSNLVVEMAQEAIFLGCYQIDDNPLVAYHRPKPLTPDTLTVTQAFNVSHAYQASWLRYSNIRLRAPPASLT